MGLMCKEGHNITEHKDPCLWCEMERRDNTIKVLRERADPATPVMIELSYKGEVVREFSRKLLRGDTIRIPLDGIERLINPPRDSLTLIFPGVSVADRVCVQEPPGRTNGKD